MVGWPRTSMVVVAVPAVVAAFLARDGANELDVRLRELAMRTLGVGSQLWYRLRSLGIYNLHVQRSFHKLYFTAWQSWDSVHRWSQTYWPSNRDGAESNSVTEPYSDDPLDASGDEDAFYLPSMTATSQYPHGAAQFSYGPAGAQTHDDSFNSDSTNNSGEDEYTTPPTSSKREAHILDAFTSSDEENDDPGEVNRGTPSTLYAGNTAARFPPKMSQQTCADDGQRMLVSPQPVGKGTCRCGHLKFALMVSRRRESTEHKIYAQAQQNACPVHSPAASPSTPAPNARRMLSLWPRG